MRRFDNRTDAGRQLADRLMEYAEVPQVLVLGLPRGGIPVAFEVARALDAPLDAYIVRKLGVPGHEELAMGAVAMDGTVVTDQDLIQILGVDAAELQAVITRETAEVTRRSVAYRGSARSPEIRGRTVILIDDGIATGSTMRAAILALKKLSPKQLIVAVPVAAPDSLRALTPLVDRMISLDQPEHFMSVGQWYYDFGQTTDQEVKTDLALAHQAKLDREKPKVSPSHP